jgi:type I restriction enzyme S subunit
MELTKQKLGMYIERIESRNYDLKYGIDDVRGISNSKEIQPTKADISERSFTRFQIVNPHNFVFNRRTTRMGEKIGLGYNDTGKAFIVTEDYVVFKVLDESVLLPDYLYMFFCRPEFDRYARWDSWGSATEFFNWEEMCDVPIMLPSLIIQQKYVDIYNAMLANQQSYERGLEDLKLVCDAYVDQLKHTCKHIQIGKYITITDERNTDNEPMPFKGLSMENYFIDSIANEVGLDFSKYKKVNPNEFACVLMKVGRDCRLTVAHNASSETYLISPAYYSFKLDGINSDYFMTYLSRSEFERRAWFSCDTSARGSLPWSEFCALTIPQATDDEQLIVADLYKSYIERNNISNILKVLIKEMCPILIKGSLEESCRLKGGI